MRSVNRTPMSPARALCGTAADTEDCEDAAYYGAHYAAKDQARAQRGEPAEDDAGPARAQLGLTPLAVGHPLLAHVTCSPIGHSRSPPYENQSHFNALGYSF